MPSGVYKRKPNWISPTSFKKGHIPWSKGKKGISFNTGRTHLKKGCKPWNKGKKLGPNLKHSLWMKGRIGEKSSRWIKDRTKLKTEENKAYNSRYKHWSLEVKRRDNWKCKINNCDCKGRLESHHILTWKDFPELRYEINNGITLCQFHHPHKRSEERRLIPLFQSMVEVIRV